jgi:hypothetical protein
MRTPLLLVVVAASACTHHQNIVEAHELVGEEVEVELYGRPPVEAVGVHGRMPGTVDYVARNGEVIDGNSVIRVSDERHLRGAVEGLGLGALIGGGAGAILGFADGDDECDNDHCWFQMSAEGKAVLFGFVFGVLGGGVGLVVGAVRGSTIVYESPSSQTSVRVGGNDGSLVTVRW